MDSRVSITPCHHLRTTYSSTPGHLPVPWHEGRPLDIVGADGGVKGTPRPWPGVKEQNRRGCLYVKHSEHRDPARGDRRCPGQRKDPKSQPHLCEAKTASKWDVCSTASLQNENLLQVRHLFNNISAKLKPPASETSGLTHERLYLIPEGGDRDPNRSWFQVESCE